MASLLDTAPPVHIISKREIELRGRSNMIKSNPPLKKSSHSTDHHTIAVSKTPTTHQPNHSPTATHNLSNNAKSNSKPQTPSHVMRSFVISSSLCPHDTAFDGTMSHYDIVVPVKPHPQPDSLKTTTLEMEKNGESCLGFQPLQLVRMSSPEKTMSLEKIKNIANEEGVSIHARKWVVDGKIGSVTSWNRGNVMIGTKFPGGSKFINLKSNMVKKNQDRLQTILDIQTLNPSESNYHTIQLNNLETVTTLVNGNTVDMMESNKDSTRGGAWLRKKAIIPNVHQEDKKYIMKPHISALPSHMPHIYIPESSTKRETHHLYHGQMARHQAELMSPKNRFDRRGGIHIGVSDKIAMWIAKEREGIEEAININILKSKVLRAHENSKLGEREQINEDVSTSKIGGRMKIIHNKLEDDPRIVLTLSSNVWDGGKFNVYENIKIAHNFFFFLSRG